MRVSELISALQAIEKCFIGILDGERQLIADENAEVMGWIDWEKEVFVVREEYDHADVVTRRIQAVSDIPVEVRADSES